ncbi:MAG: SLC13 family permease [Chloroflexi bacterium]|nr:MAG: SLC13 family permease [Chloroflexota bacterium]
MILTFVILTITIVLFIIDKLRVDIVALLSLLALALTGLISSKEALSGFSNSTVVTIAGLFVVGEGLFRTGVADWLGDRLIRLAGDSEMRLLVALMLGTALLSGFLSNTGTTAVLLPVVVAAAWRIGSAPSKLLMPLAFAASIGGMLTLIGTPPNIVVADALSEKGLRPFGFFEFGYIGLPLLVVGIVYMVVLGKRWLPYRKVARPQQKTSTSTPEELVKTYQLDGKLARLRVRRGSTLAGQSLAQASIGRDYGVNVLKVIHRNGNGDTSGRLLDTLSGAVTGRRERIIETAPDADTLVHADDILVVEGDAEAIDRMAVRFNLGILPPDANGGQPQEDLLSREVGLAEILLTPRSALIGQTITEASFADKYKVQVLAISRRGKPIDDEPITDVRLNFGDTLLVRGTWQAFELLENETRNFVVVGRPVSLVKPEGLTWRSVVAILAMLGMLVMMVTGVVSTVIAVIITGMVMVLAGCVNPEQAYRSINWESVILIAAMLPMSTALQATGGAEFIANGLVNSLGVYHPLLLLTGVFILTTSFTQVISNTATTVLVAPIAIQAAQNMGISPYPVLMMVALGASSAFLTPIATPPNTLVLTPGGYRFGDFIKAGLPMMVLFLLVSLLLVPLIWPL